MYIRKSVLCVITGILGVSVLAVLCVLFCFAQTNVPTAVYAVGWFGCLGAMMAAAGRRADQQRVASDVKRLKTPCRQLSSCIRMMYN